MVDQAPIAVDLFSGAGGLAEGLLKAGLNVAASVELHPQPSLTHAFNHPSTQVLVGDIRQLETHTLDEVLRRQVGDRPVDVVVGGPPCQGFSSAGKKVQDDPRNSLFLHYTRIVDHLRPRMFLMENVPGFRSMYGGLIYDEALRGMRDLGYETTDRIVELKRYGVPQTRRRFVLVGWLPGSAKPFKWPEATHAEAAPGCCELLFADPRRTFVTAGEAIMDLADLKPGWSATRYTRDAFGEFSAECRSGSGLVFNHLATRHRSKAANVIARIPVGGSIRDLPASERGTKKLTMSKLDPGSVSNTVVSMPDDLLHFSQDRILTVRECARLQTFDDDFVFFGKRTSGFVERRVDVPQYTQVGNAVPPRAGFVLGRALISSLGGDSVDLREKDKRLRLHELVLGTSGYSGYELNPAAADEIRLLTVTGRRIELPFASDLTPVSEQEWLVDWTTQQNPRRGQWAPGVEAKDRPSWDSGSAA